MASSSQFLCMAVVVIALSLSTSSARPLPGGESSGDQAELFKKHIPFPKLKPLFHHKKPIVLPKVKVFKPHHPESENGGVDDSKFPSFPRASVPRSFNIPRGFGNIPRSFNIPSVRAGSLAPYLSSPSLPFPDLPLVPAIPLTPPSVPVPIRSSPASTSAAKKINDQSP